MIGLKIMEILQPKSEINIEQTKGLAIIMAVHKIQIIHFYCLIRVHQRRGHAKEERF